MAEKAKQLELELKENQSKVQRLKDAEATKVNEQGELDKEEKTKAKQLEKLDAEIAKLRDIEIREREEHVKAKQAALEARRKQLKD